MNFARQQIASNAFLCECCPSLSSLKNNEELELKIYPNPTSSIIYINAEQSLKSITLTDQMGCVVFKDAAIFSNNYELILDHFSPGSYVIQMTIGNNIINRIVYKK